MSFENLNIESINICPELEFNSGLKTKLYFAPAAFFISTPLPVPAESFESEIKITEEIILQENKLLKSIDILIDENELKHFLVGDIARKRGKINLSIYILGFRPAVIGFIERVKNVPFVFFIQDANGNNWQVGHLRNRAFIEAAESGSGKKYEDNSGSAITITCNSPLFLYKSSLDGFSKFGDFNKDFNNDFFI